MSGMMMKIAHARNEAQLSSGPACRNGNTKSTKKMKNAMGIPPFLSRVGYIKRTAPLVGAAQFLDSRIYIFGRGKVKGGRGEAYQVGVGLQFWDLKKRANSRGYF